MNAAELAEDLEEHARFQRITIAVRNLPCLTCGRGMLLAGNIARMISGKGNEV